MPTSFTLIVKLRSPVNSLFGTNYELSYFINHFYDRKNIFDKQEIGYRQSKRTDSEGDQSSVLFP